MIGFTVIVYVTGAPGTPAAVGITEIVATIGAVVLFVATNKGALPLPLAPSPIAVLLFVQVYVVPGVALVKFDAGTLLPTQYVLLLGTVTSGVGLTVIV